MSTSGLLNIRVLSKALHQYLPISFDELQIFLVINATNLNTGTTTYFSKGNLVESILAASCIPRVFKPIEIDDDRYVDGGMLNNLPI